MNVWIIILGNFSMEDDVNTVKDVKGTESSTTVGQINNWKSHITASIGPHLN